MEKNKTQKTGYMRIGEIAKKMGVSVRTLQYYHKEGLLSPSSESEGGRRLYADKDMVQLHQIISLKQLGFSLDDIKGRLISLDSPQDVAGALSEQADGIRAKINNLSEALKMIETLKEEVLQMQSVDFKKYADIIVNLQMENEFYWVIKHFDDTTLDHIRGRFDQESGRAMLDTFNRLYDKAILLQKQGISPSASEGIQLAKEFWEMLYQFTGGDLSLLPKLQEFAQNMSGQNVEWGQKIMIADSFISPALEAFFQASGHDPFEEGSHESGN